MPEQNADLCYPVLTPFKFRRVVVKPPAFVQMSAAEARPYQAAGVLGNEDSAALPPEGDDGANDSAPVVEPAEANATELPADTAAPTDATKPLAASAETATPKPAAKASTAPAAKKAAAKKKAAK